MCEVTTSLFDKEELAQIEEQKKTLLTTRIKYVAQEELSVEDLFGGYNKLHVVTYSYDLKFIEKILRKFEYAEIIIGEPALMNKELCLLFALQEFLTEEVRANKYLKEMIKNDRLKLFALDDFVSHEKIYLLESDDGRVRTITGSPNFSARAWSGYQKENILFSDEEELYTSFYKKYVDIRNASTDSPSKKGIVVKTEDDITEDLGITKRIRRDTAIVVVEGDIKEPETEYNLHARRELNKLNEKWRKDLASVRETQKKDGLAIVAKSVITALKKREEKKKETEDREIKLPKLLIDYDEHSITFNGIEWDLTAMYELAIKTDLENIKAYMDKFDDFTGDIWKLKRTYWKIFNYLLLSPFIARIRREMKKRNENENKLPLYMLIVGPPNAGKTNFITFMRKVMFNTTTTDKDFLGANQFLVSKMTALKEAVKGIYIPMEEIQSSNNWRYAGDIVKSDQFLLDSKYDNHPTFVILSNQINKMTSDVGKRVVKFEIEAQLDNEKAMENTPIVYNVISKIENNFYKEYLTRMFNVIDEIFQFTESDLRTEKNSKIDLFEISSKIILSIMNDNNVEIPSELTVFSWKDYRGNKHIGEEAVEIIKKEYSLNPSMFKVDKKKNEITIDFSEYVDPHAAKIKIGKITTSLPVACKPEALGYKVKLVLDELEDVVGINFEKKSFWKFWE